MSKKIVLTGGGTAGHVTPNLALLPYLRAEGYEIVYIGSENGIERSLIEAEGVTYYGIPTGKLRRYLSKENLSDMFKVVKGIHAAKKLLKKLKPDLVFSKGGFVAVPVVLGAKKNNIPVIIHESDITPGLANKIAMPSARVICSTFPETLQYVPKGKGVHTGTPIRKELFEGDRAKGLAACGFSGEKPVLLMMGGSLGAVKLNNCLREILPELTKTFDIIHLCGKGNLDETLLGRADYKQFEYVSDGLNDLFAAADFIVSRAGSNSISEFLALKKPHLLIPLSARASRGDQILNAASFEKQGFARVLDEDEMTPASMQKEIFALYENKDKYVAAMEKSRAGDGVEAVMTQIKALMR
ncbi:undecaprenyldiphospho-muramoylpentapeptide beta-N-acetylglucosaminyltransferase [Anaerotignum sp.]|nr:undecaprenyldiphospho-muramoylpentapeptide beta-N-acetylglucosaminyltransferase [Anaerotignum sp.]MCI5679407.1 undecaprenyldiphospho-muramoylpentapeptide beta-N-acetylglucosaminyltransferase [Bacteroidales bacterium]MDY3927507.1 undecaprenyldiphospho-muramoylpentapeptide beta-N-acetylglucosaminyltransferase [Anaerotignum sp.]